MYDMSVGFCFIFCTLLSKRQLLDVCFRTLLESFYARGDLKKFYTQQFDHWQFFSSESILHYYTVFCDYLKID